MKLVFGAFILVFLTSSVHTKKCDNRRWSGCESAGNSKELFLSKLGQLFKAKTNGIQTKKTFSANDGNSASMSYEEFLSRLKSVITDAQSDIIKTQDQATENKVNEKYDVGIEERGDLMSSFTTTSSSEDALTDLDKKEVGSDWTPSDKTTNENPVSAGLKEAKFSQTVVNYDEKTAKKIAELLTELLSID